MIRILLLTAGMLAFGNEAMAATQPMATPQPADVKAGVDAWSTGDYSLAIRDWRPLADRGDPDAMFNLAQAYKMGRGVPMDLATAEDLYGKAAAKGHMQAADAYGLMLFQRGERQRALPYIEASAARGDPRAQYILGIAHFNGDLVKKDWVRAYALASLAQRSGLSQATSALAQMDQHIPLADRQKSVVLAQQIASQAQANRQRINASAELGTAGPANANDGAAQIVEAEAMRIAGSDTATTAGADYARPRESAKPKPVALAAVDRPAPAKAEPHPAAKAAPEKAAPPKPAATPPAPKPAPVAKPAAPRPAAPPPTASGPWRVQLGAFGVAGNAEALWARVKGRPELAGHPRAMVPAGKLTKLQATGFASKAEADAACARMTAGNFACVAARD